MLCRGCLLVKVSVMLCSQTCDGSGSRSGSESLGTCSSQRKAEGGRMAKWSEFRVGKGKVTFLC